MPGYDPYAKKDEEIKNYDTAQWAGGVGSGALTGATAGSTFGPWGTVIGGVLGAGAGALMTSEQEKAYIEQQKQQNALNADLASRDVYDRMLQQQGLLGQSQQQEAILNARQQAARGGLTPSAQIGLERQAAQDIAMQQSSQRPGMFLAAQQADLARRNQVLAEYQTAQNLAEQSAPMDYSQLWGQVAGSAAQLGTMTKQNNAAPAATTPGEQVWGATDANGNLIQKDQSAAYTTPGEQVWGPITVPSIQSPPAVAAPAAEAPAAPVTGPQPTVSAPVSVVPAGAVAAPATRRARASTPNVAPATAPQTAPAPPPATQPVGRADGMFPPGTSMSTPLRGPTEPAPAPATQPVGRADGMFPPGTSMSTPLRGPTEPASISKIDPKLIEAAKNVDADTLINYLSGGKNGVTDFGTTKITPTTIKHELAPSPQAEFEQWRQGMIDNYHIDSSVLTYKDYQEWLKLQGVS